MIDRLALRVIVVCALCTLIMCGCVAQDNTPPIIPALEYAKRIRAEYSYQEEAHRRLAQRAAPRVIRPVVYPEERAQLRFVKDYPRDSYITNEGDGMAGAAGHSVGPVIEPEFDEYRAPEQPLVRDYQGPLSLGEPGVSASLWRESRSLNNLFRDHRAYQPMDLVTILISEDIEGTHEADTEVKGSSSLTAAITDLFSFADDVADSNSNLNTASLINAETQNDFKGEGDTERKSSFRGSISAMVVEVLPSGILRVEGEKIISVNNEEQIMILSGLVRPRDVNSNNEVQSSQVANMRIDYYGRGTVAEAQFGGWLARTLRVIWPF